MNKGEFLPIFLKTNTVCIAPNKYITKEKVYMKKTMIITCIAALIVAALLIVSFAWVIPALRNDSNNTEETTDGTGEETTATITEELTSNEEETISDDTEESSIEDTENDTTASVTEDASTINTEDETTDVSSEENSTANTEEDFTTITEETTVEDTEEETTVADIEEDTTEGETLVAGLYDADNNLVASWDTLVNTYGMDAQRDYSDKTYNTNPASPYYVLTNTSELSSGVCMVIDSSTPAIGSYAFYRCAGLATIVIPDSVTTIGASAFRNCVRLASITIGKGVASVGEDAFYGCTHDCNVYISDMASWCNIAFADLEANPLCFQDSSYDKNLYLNGRLVTNVVIPANVTSISKYAFAWCRSLKSVTISDNVTRLGAYAFYNCTALEEIHFNATEMEDLAPCNSVFTCAGQDGNGIKVVIGTSATKIPAYLFDAEADAAYSPKIVRLEFSNGSACTSIGISAFDSCTDLSAVLIPNSVKNIGEYAFSNCSGLINVTLGTGLTGIDKGVFTKCTSLVAIEIPNSVISIGDDAFSDCTSLANIEIPNSVTSIGRYAFSCCESLASVSLGSGVTSVGTQAFSWCVNIVELTVASNNSTFHSRGNCVIETASNTLVLGCKTSVIPDYVTSIGSSAFYGCEGLTGIEIPAGVTNIGSAAFRNCTGLNTIIFKGMLAEWNSVTLGKNWNYKVPAAYVTCSNGSVALN